MGKPTLQEAIEQVVQALLDRNPELAPGIAVIAEHVALMARQHHPAGGLSASAAIPAPDGSLTPQPSAGISKTEHVPEPAASNQPARIVDHRPSQPLSSGYVPLRMPDGTVKQVRVSGTGADIAAARFSADEPAHGETDEGQARRHQPPNLSLIAARCELKVEGCAASIDRRAVNGTDREQEEGRRIGALINRGRQLDNCFLWMVYPGKAQPDDEQMRLIAAAYANLAWAARVCERVPRGGHVDRRTTALELLAESQSALRMALTNTWLTSPDKDQDDAFHYLDDSTTYEQIFIGRHMKLSDPADPGEWESLRERLAAFGRELDDVEANVKKDRAVVSRIKHHARLIASDPAGEHGHDWERIEEALGKLSVGRMRDGEVLNLLRPIAGSPPEGLPNVARAIAGLRGREHGESPEGDGDRYSDAVGRVRDMVRGRRMVIVGGERREEAAARIRSAFELSELEWVELPEHSSSAPAEAPIRRPDTRIVLILIRLAGHLHVEDVTAFCERHGKALVRLPAGYNPERIAAEVLEQVSGKLV